MERNGDKGKQVRQERNLIGYLDDNLSRRPLINQLLNLDGQEHYVGEAVSSEAEKRAG